MHSTIEIALIEKPMDNTVSMPALPEDLELPTDLQGKIYFDSRQQKLICRGFMCKTEYDRLLRLSEDCQYQRALVTLFQNSTVTHCRRMRQLGRILSALTIAALVLVVVVWWLLLADLHDSHSDHSAREHSAKALLPLSTG
jgi:hypothetical protein